MAELPQSVLQTEAAIRVGLLIAAGGYEVEATPRPKGADLAAARRGTVWATFHLDVDPKRPLLLRFGATVWGGARVAAGFPLTWDSVPGAAMESFVKDRLALACKKGREESPDHCAACPEPAHRALSG